MTLKAEYIDHMGDDLRVVNSARVSFDKESNWKPDCCGNGTQNGCCGEPMPTLSEKDIKLLNYLAKHGHWTPFSHVMITMRETVPIFVARQRFKHMVGFTYNEVSRRYVDGEPEFYTPDVWRGKPENAKQGSSDIEINDLRVQGFNKQTVSEGYDILIHHAEILYNDMIEAGVAPEQARMVLPQSMYTSYYVTGSLAAWARAYKQRIDPHAQKEIQDLAKQWGDIMGSINEIHYSWEALTKEQNEPK